MALSSLWVKVSTLLPRHPKTIAAAASLGVTVAEVVGHLCMLWIYCSEFRPSGVLASCEELATACGWEGNEEFLARGLENIPGFSGFIERHENENGLEIVIHDWDVFNFAASSAEEKRREKKKKEEDARNARDHENMKPLNHESREIPEETKKALEAILKRNKDIYN